MDIARNLSMCKNTLNSPSFQFSILFDIKENKLLAVALNVEDV